MTCNLHAIPIGSVSSIPDSHCALRDRLVHALLKPVVKRLPSSKMHRVKNVGPQSTGYFMHAASTCQRDFVTHWS